MQKKIGAMGILALFLTVGLLAIGTGDRTYVNENADLAAIDQEETYPDTPGSLAVVFTSIDELYEHADLVVKGTVTATGRVELQTHSTVRVEAVLKGGHFTRTVTVMESPGGVPHMEEGQQFILFLVESEWEEYPDNYYIAGAFQGKFIQREGYYFQQATGGVKLSGEEYEPCTYDEFRKRLK